MSPTCTVPYELLFCIVNDTPYAATFQTLRIDDGLRTGPTMLLHKGEAISLVLTAGLPYRYAVRQHGKEANLSVKLWDDSQCSIQEAFAPLTCPHESEHSDRCMSDGVTVSLVVFKRHPTFRRIL